MWLPAVLAAVTTGFLAGLLTFRRTGKWCPCCGAVARCPECPTHPTPNEARLAIVGNRASRRSQGDAR